MRISVLFLAVLICLALKGLGQVDFIPVSNKGIYEFIDELSNIQAIQFATTIKPYSSLEVYQQLQKVDKSELNARQRKELDFYLREYQFVKHSGQSPYADKGIRSKNKPSLSINYNPLGIFYVDSLMSFQLRPVWGVKRWQSEDGEITKTWGGAEFRALIGNHVGIYSSLRDNHLNEYFVLPEALTQEKGGSYQLQKSGRVGADFNEAIGGVTVNWDWGHVGLIKDNLIWGDQYNGAIIQSGRTPSFPMIKLQMKPAPWLDINYFHGWLVSEVLDSARTYTSSNGDIRYRYRPKFMAANSFTIRPAKGLNLTLGNSIIYSDMKFNPGYLLPVLFYKSVDHTLNHLIDNENSQMFFNVSIRSIRNLHLYGTSFIDELKISRVFDPNLHNFIGAKAGFRLSNWPVQNLAFTGEFTHGNPITYRHRIETLSYESNGYNLGHYLTDNAREFFVSAEYRPFARFVGTFYSTLAQKGNTYPYVRRPDPTANPVLKDIVWQNRQTGVKASYQFLNNSYLHVELVDQSVTGSDADGLTEQDYLDRYSPKLFQGQKLQFVFGGSFGF